MPYAAKNPTPTLFCSIEQGNHLADTSVIGINFQLQIKNVHVEQLSGCTSFCVVVPEHAPLL